MKIAYNEPEIKLTKFSSDDLMSQMDISEAEIYTKVIEECNFFSFDEVTNFGKGGYTGGWL